MRTFISGLCERNFQNRTVAFIENGSWAPMATRVMKSMLEKCKNLSFAQTEVKLLSALSKDSELQICSLARELLEKGENNE
jgi:flavorubredoxin